MDTGDDSPDLHPEIVAGIMAELEEAFPVLTCMEQTGQTRRECRRDIRDSNGQPPVP